MRPGQWLTFQNEANLYDVSTAVALFQFNHLTLLLVRFHAQKKYGPDWMDHLPTSKFDFTSIKDLIDHVINQGNLLFADTRFKDSSMIYHDALPQ